MYKLFKSVCPTKNELIEIPKHTNIAAKLRYVIILRKEYVAEMPNF